MGAFEARCECGKTAYDALVRAVLITADTEDIAVTPAQVREAVALLIEMATTTPEIDEQYEATLQASDELEQRRRAATLRAIEPKPAERPHLYFMHCPTTGLVKIGVSNDVQRRRNQVSLASGLPVEILHVIPNGGYELESKLHGRYRALRETGEWFRREGDLAAYLEQIAAA